MHEKVRLYYLIALVGLLLSTVSLVVIYQMDSGLSNAELVTFNDPAGDLLHGTYYTGSVQGGVLLLEGFGSDQTALLSVTSELQSMGLHLFTFDFSGHGQSLGALGFDNAATDRLALQVLAAKEQFKTLSGLQDFEIMMFGHSMGARVAVQAEVLDTEPVAGLVLFGPQINLDTNVQSEFFTGVSDSELDWIQSLNATVPSMDLLMVVGEFDDIIPPSSAEILYDNLTAGGLSTYARELVVIPGLVHNYEVYSPQAISLAKLFVADTLGLSTDGVAQTPTATIRPVLWIVGVIGIFLALITGDRVLKETIDNDSTENQVQIMDTTRFLRWKLILWLAALPVFMVLAVLFFLIPLGIPVFNIVYVGFIGSYGLVLLLLYTRGNIRGVEGRLKVDLSFDTSIFLTKEFLLAIGITLAVTIWCVLFARTGILFVYPLNERLVWLVVFTVITSFGFYVGQKEYQITTGLDNRGRTLLWNTLIAFLPFFLLSVLWYAIGSLSGMIGSLHGLLILTIVSLVGNPVQRLGRNAVFTAVFQSFLLQLLILPQGVLFAFW